MQNLLLSPHFAQMEFTESPTAKKHGIDNTPTPTIVNNLRSLCVNTMEPLREELGLPVIISSGYRSKALNALITHHSNSSQHMFGRAADFHIGEALESSGSGSSSGLSHRERLIKAFRLIITSDKIDYDQVILYPTFIHVSYVSRDKNRHKITKANGHGTYCALTRAQALSLI